MKSRAAIALKNRCFLALISMSLAGSASGQAHAQSESVAVNSTNFCLGLGLTPGGSAYRECVSNLAKSAVRRSDALPVETPSTIRNDAITAPASRDFCLGLGLTPGGSAYRECVSNLAKSAVRRSDALPVETPSKIAGDHGSPHDRAPQNRGAARTSVPVQASVKAQTNLAALTPHEQSCSGYGFKRGTNQFAQCLMQLDQAQQQAEFEQRRYDLQMAQYQQQQAVYEAQQAAIKKERDRRKWAALAMFGAGMASTNSPTFGGGLADGFRALNGQPPLPAPTAPVPPEPRNYTVRLPNGNQVYCHYSGSYMSCR